MPDRTAWQVDMRSISKAGIIRRTVQCMARCRRQVGLTLLSAAMYVAGPGSAEEKRTCTESLAAFSQSARIEADGRTIRAGACANLSNVEGTVLLAFAVEPAGYPQSTDHRLTKRILVVGAGSPLVLSSHEGTIAEDAVTRVRADSLNFDLAPYVLAKGVRAFGLRLSAYYEPKFSEGGADDYLSLYVIEGKKIRPVLNDLSMREWKRRGKSPEDIDDPCKTLTTTYTLSVAKTVSNGFADLLISARTSCRRKISTHWLRYDGASYPFELTDLWIKLSGSK